MATRGGHVVTQDYIVRQRYSNALPPPPGAPKLLDIPNNGLDLYTMPFYAVPLLHEQPVNVEADAFLGMPIDLVGMPGVFEGDESSIQAPDIPPPLLNQRDRNLLMPLKQLGKQKNEASDISFLRRTQHIADERARLEAVRGPGAKVNPNKRLRADVSQASKEDPTHILRSVIKGFDLANPESAYTGPDTATQIRGLASTPAERAAWDTPTHPSKPDVTVLDSYPLLPDLDACTPVVTYGLVRIGGNPTAQTDGPDRTLQTSLLHALDPTPADATEWEARRTRHAADPVNNRKPPPEPPHDYALFTPRDLETAEHYSTAADAYNSAARDSQADGDNGPSFRFRNVRRYGVSNLVDCGDFPYQECALALYDVAPEADAGRQVGAYYYPVGYRMGMKPKAASEREKEVHEFEVQVREPDEEELELKQGWLGQVDTRDEVMAE